MEKKELFSLIRQSGSSALTDSERAKLLGNFIKLPCGNTHYEISGEGKPVVLVHGFATPYNIYDKVFASLVQSGHRVLRYDLLGRGLSERVKAVYNPELFARQLDEITREFFGDEKFILFGVSMGCTVVTSFCRFYPGKAEKIVLFSPAGMDTFKPPLYMKICKVPVLGNVVFSIIGAAALISKNDSELKHTPQAERDEYIRKFALSTKYKGFTRCVLSSLRNTILNTQEDMKGYISVNNQAIPVLAVWGTDDETMPYEQHTRFTEVCPNAQFVTLDGSGHDFLYDECERAMNIALPFICGKS